MHKDNTPLRPVILCLGSTYYNLNKILATFRKKTEGASLELNTNLPLKEKIDIALRTFMSKMNYHQLLGKPRRFKQVEHGC